ncbi:protein of unknown function DUF324 [Methanocaldococcus vulcanius M7]|uniref:CRISPR type III-associated protein domain-containing protein n=1 Tax=Methanocaldococcus vulcanius (strain ATCC 700851 / DSM 12094 / M7) TaxID=579137 RepID=C9RHU4_METVM|nr:RAMP superfamily CRISPR-associated protein [Methanocaldococcus vulcanius]ACX73146.1 protein of unknown function DUF324 [Methanocaldococcus vulcanius M7]
MSKYDALIEINVEKITNLSEYFLYMKYYFKPKNYGKIENYLFKRNNKPIAIDNKFEKLIEDFPFLKIKFDHEIQKNNLRGNLFKTLKKYKSLETLKDFPLTYFKNEIIGHSKIFEFSEDENLEMIRKISIFSSEEDLKNTIKKHPKYSFGIWVKFELNQPYFSRDDEEFYLIQNPVLKEKVFKVPMIRGSGWKGAIANAGRELIKENIDKKEFWDYVFSYLRIFGTGNEEFRELINLLKNKNKDELKKSLLKYLIFNLNVAVEFDNIEKDWKKIIEEHFDPNFRNIFNYEEDKKKYYEAKKGKVVFYPTYFDRLSLEVINPHSRKTRAGTNPIHYEVVPKGVEGILQIVYVPFDGILKKDDKLKEEVEKDLRFLCECIKKVAGLGVGAKTKLGWGTFEIKEKVVYSNKEIEIPEGWGDGNRCE